MKGSSLATVVAAVLALAAAPGAFAGTFVVNTTADHSADACDSECTLRDAITAANAAAGPHTIEFAIPGPGAQRIRPSGALPMISSTVTIDGTTQTGYLGPPLIEIDGSIAGTADGLVVGGSGSVVKALSVTSFGAGGKGGIVLAGLGSSRVERSYLGLAPDGTVKPNHAGIIASSAGNTVGGAAPSARNVISGNSSIGVSVVGSAAPTTIASNYIGTDVAGAAAVGNGQYGILVNNVATVTISSNVIAGNISYGVLALSSPGLVVEGNAVGTNAARTAAVPNGGGIVLSSTSDSRIGGTSPVSANVISGNGFAESDGSGVHISGGSGNTVAGNIIGLDGSGSTVIPNRANGVFVNSSPGNVVGGATAGSRNVISGNGDNGVLIASAGSTSNSVQNNYIGVDVTGALARPNSERGILLNGASNNTIGGSGNVGNVIAANAMDGVMLAGASDTLVQNNWIGTNPSGASLGNGAFGAQIASGANNLIASNTIAHSGAAGVALGSGAGVGNGINANQIHSNATLGIDLGPTGVTANDALDADSGPNGLQNFPVLTDATAVDGSTTVTGTLSSEPGTQYWIQVFSNTACDASGNGEGALYHGMVSVTTDATGNAAFTHTLPSPAGVHVTATAMRGSDNSTSEFSACRLVEDAGPPALVVNSTDDADDGSCDLEHCSLREALQRAMTNFAPDNIYFGIGSGPQTIHVTSQLPAITSDTVLDGTTQPGYEPGGPPIIEIEGSGDSTPGGINGLRITGNNNFVRGLVINRFSNRAIWIEHGDDNSIQSSYIGTNAAGSAGLAGLNFVGIEIRGGATGNFIGGVFPDQRNVLYRGVRITQGATGNHIQGNYIGVGADGATPLGGGFPGVTFDTTTSGNMVGGAGGRRNVISGNAGGVSVGGDANRVRNNVIGLAADGLAPVGNGSGNGVTIFSGATNAVVENNVISANGGHGVRIEATGAVVRANTIGTDAAGALDRGNGGHGVQVAAGSANVIGGPNAIDGNLISGNGAFPTSSSVGISIIGSATGTVMQNNLIGTNATAAGAVPNSLGGVQLSANGNVLGLSAPADTPATQGNVIAGNGGIGVIVVGNSNSIKGNFVGTDKAGTSALGHTGAGIDLKFASSSNVVGQNTVANTSGPGVVVSGTGTANDITANSIRSNSQLGIDLAPAGVTANDAGDADTGANSLQNFPVVTSASATPLGVSVAGTINTAAASSVRIELFSNVACDSSGNGEGETLVGSTNVTADASGNASFSGEFTSGGPVPVGRFITATATVNGNTSEFGSCVAVAAAPTTAPDGSGTLTTTATVVPAGATGNTLTFTYTAAAGGMESGTVKLAVPAGWSEPSAGSSAAGYTTASAGAVTVAGRDIGVSGVTLAGGETLTIVYGSRAGDGPGATAPPEPVVQTWQTHQRSTAGGTLTALAASPVIAVVATLSGNVLPMASAAECAPTVPRSGRVTFEENLPGPLAERYASLGVHIVDDATRNPFLNTSDASRIGGSTQSPPNSLGFFADGGATLATTALELTFDEDQTAVGFYMGNNQNGGAGVTATVTAYDAAGASLGSVSAAVAGNDVTQFFGIKRALGGIRKVTIFYGAQWHPEIDDLCFVRAGVTGATVVLSTQSPSTQAGAAQVRQRDLPVSAIGGSSTTRSAPMDGIPMDGIPMDGIPMDGIPMDGIPMDGIGLTIDDLAQNGLGGVPLSTIPLTTPAGGWAQLLQNTALAGLPVDTLTLADVLRLAPAALAPVRMSHVDFSASALSSLPLVVLVLGGMALDDIPILGHKDAQNRQDWCSLIDQAPGFDCSTPSTLAGETLTGIALRGVPMDGIPMDGIPMDGIPMDGIPMDGIPMDGIDLRGTRLGAVRLLDIDMSVSPVAALPLAALPADAVDCAVAGSNFSCSGATIGPAAAAGALTAEATLADLHGHFGTITLGQLLDGLPAGLTLHDLFEALLGGAGYSWSRLPRSFPLQDFALEGGAFTYTARVTLTGSGDPTAATVRLSLPPGSRYVAGSARLTHVGSGTQSTLAEPVATGNTLTLALPPIDVGAAYDVAVGIRPGLELGTRAASASVTVDGIAAVASAPIAVGVTETYPANDDAATAPVLVPGSLYVSHVPHGDDVDQYRVAIPAEGASVTVHLVRNPIDLDLSVSGPALPSLRSAPMDGIPMDGIMIAEEEVRLEQRTEGLSPEAVHDVSTPAVAGQTIRAVSAARGTFDEEVRVVSVGETGYYTIQVSSYGSASSALDYMLYVEVNEPPALGACAARTFAHAGEGVAGPAPVVPAGANTLFLTSKERLGDTYGAAGMNDVMGALTRLAGRSDIGITGAVVSVESNAAVAQAYDLWDASPCSPQRANDVVRAILGLVDGLRAANPGLEYVVPVGGDDIIPMARLLDQTVFANERGYTSTFGRRNNQTSASFANSYILSDDPYGDTNTSTLVGAQLHIPELAVGRVVESPSQIVAQVGQFERARGRLDPRTQLVASYDFLTDMGDELFSALTTLVGPGTNLTGNSWTRSDLLAAMFPSTGAPLVNSINMHYDHFRALPADQNAAHKQSEVLATTDISSRGSAATAGRVIMTVGCHSGLGIPNSLFAQVGPPGFASDWPETYAGASAAVYLGNTGYGLGDTAAVAYSERLHELLAKRFSGPIGDALVASKQEYWAGLAVVSGYDAKVTTEATLYGFPMYRIGAAAAPPAPPAPLATAPDPLTGLVSADFTVNPSFVRVDAANGVYYKAGAGEQATSRRPIEPLVAVEATQPDETAHDVVLTRLVRTSQGIDAAFSRPVFDEATTEPELVGEITFPTRLQATTSFDTPAGRRQRALLVAGRFRSDGQPDAQGVGVQELFTTIGGTILYSDSDDFRRPTICGVEIAKIGTNVAFAVCARDLAQSGAAGQVKAVVVLYRGPGDGAFARLDLDLANGLWSGAGPIAGESVDYFVQVIDAAGNVGVASNKGAVAPIPPSLPGGDVGVHLGGSSTGGWFSGPVLVTLTPPAGVTVDYSVDGGPLTRYEAPFSVTGDGVRKIEFRASNGSTGSAFASIDTTAPTVATAVRTYVLGSSAAPDFTCRDAGSGVATCAVAPAQLDTSSIGTRTFTVEAVDRVGHRREVEGTYKVVWPFRGFTAPVVDPPKLNVAKAGSTTPVKFSLGGNRGLGILAADYPRSGAIACAGDESAEVLVETDTAGGSALTYDASADQYKYAWKTEAGWAGTCRQFVLKLNDGSTHRANFRFR